VIEELPGWEGKLPSKWYSGFLPSGEKEGRKLFHHYSLILSEGDPETDPLVLWTNGGPGAASIWGLMTELGPFYVSKASIEQASEDGVPKLFRNRYSWSKHASILVLNGPPPVAYSFCDPPGLDGDGFQCGTEPWNDTTTAQTNLNFLESFFEEFPEFQSHSFYLTGESYAGVYIPTLVREIMNAGSSSKTKRVLKGVAIGNGCVGNDIMCRAADGSEVAMQENLFLAEFLHGHGQFSTKLHNKIKKECRDALGHSSKCEELFNEMKRQVGGFFEYNLYDTCWDDQSLPNEFHNEQAREMMGLPVRGELNDYPCGGGEALSKWIQHEQVRESFNIPKEARFVTGDNSESLRYKSSERNLMPFMKSIALETDLRCLIYNGDTDPAINSFITEWWVNDLGLKELQPWTPWTIDGGIKMGGYVTRFEGNFDFLTFRGSGHLVPANRPAAAEEAIMIRWLHNKPWQKYNPK